SFGRALMSDLKVSRTEGVDFESGGFEVLCGFVFTHADNVGHLDALGALGDGKCNGVGLVSGSAAGSLGDAGGLMGVVIELFAGGYLEPGSLKVLFGFRQRFPDNFGDLDGLAALADD